MIDEIKPNNLLPGDIITIRHSIYKHFAIVSDQKSIYRGNALPNLISLSQRTGTICEEAWHTVVGSKTFEKSHISGSKPHRSVLSRARACMLLNIQYNVVTCNCEHFVRFACGLPVESIQVKSAFYGAAIGTITCLALPKITIARIALTISSGAIVNLRKSLDKI